MQEETCSPKIIGIDLGTTSVRAACMIKGVPTIIPMGEGSSDGGNVFPAIVQFAGGGTRIGEPAARAAMLAPRSTVREVRRKMGSEAPIVIEGKSYTPEDILAVILQKVKQEAENFLGDTVNKAVLTVPNCYNYLQRQAVKRATAAAGLETVRVLGDSLAGALVWVFGHFERKTARVMAFDLGAGKLDVTVLEVGHTGSMREPSVIQVLSTSGDCQLGGIEMDMALTDHIIRDFQTKGGEDLRKDEIAVQRVREAAEKAKIDLSAVSGTYINLRFVSEARAGPNDLVMTLSREQLEDLFRPVVARCRGPIELALSDARLKPGEIDATIMIGGGTRMPIVRSLVEEQFSASIRGGLDPMECVAMGAAIQAGMITGEVRDLLLDVVPHSISYETLGAVSTRIISRNSLIPIARSRVFSTASDFQTGISIHVVEGERPMADDNVSLGVVNFAGLAPAPRGVPRVEVTFAVDANGILGVHAKDLGTGKDLPTSISRDKSAYQSYRTNFQQILEEQKRAQKVAPETHQARRAASSGPQHDSFADRFLKKVQLAWPRRTENKRTGSACVKCGAVLPIGSRFCDRCGTKQNGRGF